MPLTAEEIVAEKKLGYKRMQAGIAFDGTLKLVQAFPALPVEVVRRFPALAQWEVAMKDFHKNLLIALQGPAAPNLETKSGK